MKRTIKHLLCVGIVLSMSFLLAACSSREPAETVVDKAMQAFQTMDKEGIAHYWGGSDLEEDLSEEDEVLQENIMMALCSSMSYTITGSEEDEAAGTAAVSVDITTIDMQHVMAAYMEAMFSDMLEYAFLPEGQRPTDEELEQMAGEKLLEIFEENKETTTTSSVTIDLTLADDTWQIEASDELADAMLGGLLSSAEELTW